MSGETGFRSNPKSGIAPNIHRRKPVAKSKSKLVIKNNEDTQRQGIAGCEILSIVGEDPYVDDIVLLTVMLRDTRGGLAGPYKIPLTQVEAVPVKS